MDVATLDPETLEDNDPRARWNDNPIRMGAHNLDVTFRKDPVTDELRVNIRFPGDPKTEIDQVATEADISNFREAFAAWQASESEGTPLDDLEWLNDGMRRQLERVGFKNLEQIAAAPDGIAESIGFPGFLDVRRHARTDLAQRRRAAPSPRENALQERVDQLEGMVKRLLAEQQSAQPRAPRRQPKAS